jgi:hypothetical protein
MSWSAFSWESCYKKTKSQKAIAGNLMNEDGTPWLIWRSYSVSFFSLLYVTLTDFLHLQPHEWLHCHSLFSTRHGTAGPFCTTSAPYISAHMGLSHSHFHESKSIGQTCKEELQNSHPWTDHMCLKSKEVMPHSSVVWIWLIPQRFMCSKYCPQCDSIEVVGL